MIGARNSNSKEENLSQYLLMAFSILYTLPAVGLWVVAGRFLKGMFTFAGAVKG